MLDLNEPKSLEILLQINGIIIPEDELNELESIESEQ